jgi:phospholipid N-methyltransferase
MKTFAFIKESLQNIKTVGTVTRSSGFLSRQMAKKVDYSEAQYVVELGAGDGVITKEILKRMAPDARLMIFEVNDKFFEQLKMIDDDRLIVVNDSAEYISKHLLQHGFTRVDAIVSAIPFVILPENVRRSIIKKCIDVMKEEAPFIQVHYSLVLRNLYKEIFGNVKIGFVPLNIPPAFVMVSRKKEKELINPIA